MALPVANEPIERGTAAPDLGAMKQICRAGRQWPWWRLPNEHRGSPAVPLVVSGANERQGARIQRGADDAATGCSRPMTVHTTESLKIGALQHLCLGHRVVPVEDYLKPKVFSVRTSTRVMALSEKNVDASNSASVRHLPGLFDRKDGMLAIIWQHSWSELPRAFDALISLWLKYIRRPPTTDPP
jgi:hypothetical protein